MDSEILALLQRPWVTPKQLHEASLLPLSLNGTYDALNRGEIESFRVGKKRVTPTAPLRRLLGIEGA